MKNLRAVTSLLLPLIILTIVVLFIFIAWKNILPQDDASKGYGVWWTALSIMCTLIVALIAFNYFKVKDIDEIKAKNKELEEKIEKSSKLATLPSRLLDIYDGEYFREKEIKSDDIINEVRTFYSNKFFDSYSIQRLSTIAWREENLKLAHDLRKLAVELEFDNCWNRAYYINILSFTEKKSEIETNGNINKFGVLPKEDAYLNYCGYYGRYLIMKEQFESGIDNIRISLQLKNQPFYLRIFILALMTSESKMEELTKLSKSIEVNDTFSNKSVNSFANIRYSIFQKFLKHFTDSYNKKSNNSDFYKLFNLTNISYFKNQSNYLKMACFHIFKSIESFENTSNKQELIQLYLTFYYFFGADDDLADKELEENPEVVNQIYANIMQYWPINQQKSSDTTDIAFELGRKLSESLFGDHSR